MKNIKWAIALAILLFFGCTEEKREETPYLVVFSLDGFRWDYQDHCHTPVLDSITKNGVKAEKMLPSFPSLTFPNHYTIATGLYPGHHGIIHNSFYDKKLKRKYSLGNREAVQDSVFYGGNPIWNHLQDYGIKTATCFWVGSEAPVNGRYANYWKIYDYKLSYKNRMDTVLHWLQLPEEKRPHFLMGYFSEPDHTGHDEGPLAPQTKQQVESLDSLLSYFIKKLKTLPYGNQVNIIVTSDHGMAAVDSVHNIVVSDFVPDTLIKAYNGGSTCLFLEPHRGYTDSVFHLASQIPNVSVHRRENTPADWHFNDTTRIDQLIVLVDKGYVFRHPDRKATTGGAHGYDNTSEDMKTIFYAIGPAFKKGYRQSEFQNVDIFPLMEEIFQLPERETTDGDLSNVIKMLIED